jgi:hypothetical protein
MTNEKLEELKAMAGPLMSWLAENHHPHMTVIVTGESAELVEGVMCARRTSELLSKGAAQ